MGDLGRLVGKGQRVLVVGGTPTGSLRSLVESLGAEVILAHSRGSSGPGIDGAGSLRPLEEVGDASVDHAIWAGGPEIPPVDQLARVTRPGGWILIAAEPPSWRLRLRRGSAARSALSRHCDPVPGRPLVVDRGAADTLYLWCGRKRPRLTGEQWHRALKVDSLRQEVVERVLRGERSEWADLLLRETAPHQKVLEIGCGTGEISLHLAKSGRAAVGLDCSHASLGFVTECARALDLRVPCVQADAARLPFRNGSFDCVWSAGLLEHFEPDERRAMLLECARVTSDRVIALVPNASCVAYRAGKQLKERQGTWEYGHETPIASLAGEFEAAGLRVVLETTLGFSQGLKFLPRRHPLRRALSRWGVEASQELIEDARQGYLLATIGSIRPAERET